MSGADSSRYQPVSVEDWDDEAQTPLPGTRTTTSVAVKSDLTADSGYASPVVQYANYDGTDSGYASKAPTVSSMASSSRRRDTDLKIDTTILERERKPYFMTATPREAHCNPAARPKENVTKEPQPVKKPFCHKKGICWVCDKYGYHFDPNKNPPDKEMLKPTTPAQPSAPPPKTVVAKPKVGEAPRPPTRRTSSNTSRPASMYVGAPIQVPYTQYAPMPQHWTATPTAPPGIVYAQYYMPPTPTVNHGYIPPQQPQQFYYEPQPVFDEPLLPPPKSSKRLSMVSTERPQLEKRPSRTNTMLERTMSREQIPQIVSHKSSRSIDADRLAMPPPPPRPQITTTASARPRPGRSQTYSSNTSSNRRPAYEEDEESDDNDYITSDHRVMVSYKEPPPSPRRPPSSYKAPQHEVAERPQLRGKSKSYNDGAIQVATTPRGEAILRRRTTESTPSVEQKEAAAEAYMKKRGSMHATDLTAENLKTLKSHINRQVPDQRSESGSANSHITHHSSSKDSSNGRGRVVSNMSAPSHAQKTSMNININGMNLAITDSANGGQERTPVKIDFGAIQLSMNNNNKENVDHRKPQKQLERAPSMSSRPSRRSLTQSSLVSSASGHRFDKEELLAIEAREREHSRRESFVDDDERDALRRTSARTSRQPSRNASTARQPIDEPSVRPKNRSSVDYSRREEPVV